ncbi:A24 family peptidase [Paenibacillus sp. ACRRX]|uniref:A24 family peptidase n=1 Tax=unclassified Paenibacillus TaxID=185978 RepID=UPI001EF5FE91|nr:MULTISPECIES: A24 family peptidase [unclassified Paenibacillus]MCG7410010.1 A24 family peptidase [Paenibacillus sp. ACRRX]MDK8182925.1 A24 family peptidase [Paenibacillus sp. UMB4589-SE434]
MQLAEGATAVLLIAAGVADIRTRKIPNKLNLTAVVTALLYYAVVDGTKGIVTSGLGLLSGFGLLLLLYIGRAVGAGDVKLFAALGAWMGSYFVWNTFFYSILYGGVIASIYLLYHYRSLGRRFVQMVLLFIGVKSFDMLRETVIRPSTFPFMLAVIPAALTVHFMDM